MSDIYIKDIKGIRNKKSHLGYNGSIKLLKNTNYKIRIASEFCCTNGDFRTDFIRALGKELENGKNNCILPGEIGFNIFLPDLKFECFICKRKTNIEHISVVSPCEEYGKIQYICRHCALDVI